MSVREILNYCRINYGSNGVSDEYEEELAARLQPLILKEKKRAVIEELEGLLEIWRDGRFTSFSEVIKERLKELNQ